MFSNHRPKAFWAYTTGNAAAAATELAMVQASRPMKPPKGLLPEQITNAGKLDAHRYNARAGRLNVAQLDADAEAEPGGTHIVVLP